MSSSRSTYGCATSLLPVIRMPRIRRPAITTWVRPGTGRISRDYLCTTAYLDLHSRSVGGAHARLCIRPSHSRRSRGDHALWPRPSGRYQSASARTRSRFAASGAVLELPDTCHTPGLRFLHLVSPTGVPDYLGSLSLHRGAGRQCFDLVDDLRTGHRGAGRDTESYQDRITHHRHRCPRNLGSGFLAGDDACRDLWSHVPLVACSGYRWHHTPRTSR